MARRLRLGRRPATDQLDQGEDHQQQGPPAQAPTPGRASWLSAQLAWSGLLAGSRICGCRPRLAAGIRQGPPPAGFRGSLRLPPPSRHSTADTASQSPWLCQDTAHPPWVNPGWLVHQSRRQPFRSDSAAPWSRGACRARARAVHQHDWSQTVRSPGTCRRPGRRLRLACNSRPACRLTGCQARGQPFKLPAEAALSYPILVAGRSAPPPREPGRRRRGRGLRGTTAARHARNAWRP
jgi:hypothetical protein